MNLNIITLLVAVFLKGALNADINYAFKKPKPKPYKQFSTGFYLNAEFNRAKYSPPNFFVRSKSRTPVQPAGGIHFSKGVTKFLFADISIGLANATYIFNFRDVNGEARLESDRMAFLQSKINFNYVINKEAYNHYIFVGGGAQFLYRLYSQKNYVNEIVANTDWPIPSFYPMIGVGVRTYFNDNSYIQPSINFRIQPQKTLIYDRTLNQVSVGIIVGGDIRNLAKKEAKVKDKNIKIKI